MSKSRASRGTSLAVALAALVAVLALLWAMPPSACSQGSAGGTMASSAYPTPRRVTWSPELESVSEFEKEEPVASGTARRRLLKPLRTASAPSMPEGTSERFRPGFTGEFVVPNRPPPERMYTEPINTSKIISDQIRARTRTETPFDAYHARTAMMKHYAAYIDPDRDPNMRRIA